MGQGAVGPFADVSVTKTVSPRVARAGGTLHYTIVVRNAGSGTAYDVVASEVDPHSDQALALHTTKGDCRGTRPARCVVGTLRKGQRATITVQLSNRPSRDSFIFYFEETQRCVSSRRTL